MFVQTAECTAMDLTCCQCLHKPVCKFTDIFDEARIKINATKVPDFAEPVKLKCKHFLGKPINVYREAEVAREIVLC